jgi:kinesin family protein 18/19
VSPGFCSLLNCEEEVWEVALTLYLVSALERKEILTRTKCISVKAAQRRSRALGTEGRHLLAPATERSSLSLHSLSEADDARPPGQLACKRPPSPTLQHAISEDNLSSSTGEGPSRAVGPRGDGTGSWVRGQKKCLSKKREESLEAKRRKRRSRSFEVTGQGVRQRAGVKCLHPLLMCGRLRASTLQKQQDTSSPSLRLEP